MDIKNTSFYVHNLDIIEVPDLTNIEFPGQGKIIYEVIRVINGKLLFIEDHMIRFMNSISLSGNRSPFTSKEITAQLHKLVKQTQIDAGNIKFFYHITAEDIQLYAHFIPHKYPNPEDYRNGILLTLFEAERMNPQIKEEHKNFREKAQNYIIQQNAYEALLLHPKGYITEGSKSNFFLIKGTKLYTAPKKDVLEGITAKKISVVCKELNIEIIEQQTQKMSLPTFDAAFIAGTSPKILPVRAIDNLIFDPKNPLLQKIMTEFDRFIQKYLDRMEIINEN
jgi:branched-chain amino acid aminotransferase